MATRRYWFVASVHIVMTYAVMAYTVMTYVVRVQVLVCHIGIGPVADSSDKLWPATGVILLRVSLRIDMAPCSYGLYGYDLNSSAI